jgi:hypothetical protein
MFINEEDAPTKESIENTVNKHKNILDIMLDKSKQTRNELIQNSLLNMIFYYD